MRQFVSYIFLIIVCLIGASSVSAQGIPVSSGIDISLSANNPAPGQTVTITAKSYNQDITSATIIWTIDGKEIKRGVGINTLETKAPALGKINTVTVTALLRDGGRISGSVTVGSGSVDLIIESDGHVPPLFLGKISPAFQNKVKVIAIPHLANTSGVEYDPKTLIYEWRRNDMALVDQSGYGKNSITIEGSLVPRPYTIEVTVRTRDGSATARGVANISPSTVSLTFYIDDPLYGPLFNKAVSNTLTLGKQRESSVLAVPYGFNKPADGQGNLSYNWTINGSSRSDLVANQSIVLRAPDNAAGLSNIGLEIKNNRDILQSAIGGFTVSFSAPVEDDSIIDF